jgi:hypothetical protein
MPLLGIYSEYLKITVFGRQNNKTNTVGGTPNSESSVWRSSHTQFYWEVVVRQLLLPYLFSVCIGTVAVVMLFNTDDDPITTFKFPIYYPVRQLADIWTIMLAFCYSNNMDSSLNDTNNRTATEIVRFCFGLEIQKKCL